MPSAPKVAGGQSIWTRDTILEDLRDYVSLYGAEALTAAAFSPSTAKWRDEPVAVERYYAGNTLRGGRGWPSLNAIKRHYSGFSAAREALGLAPNRPGSKRRPPGTAAPVRDVRERTRLKVVERVADNRLSVEQIAARVAAERQPARVERVEVPAPGDARLRRAAERAEVRLAKATERLREARVKAREASAARKMAEGEARALRGRLEDLCERERTSKPGYEALARRVEVAEREKTELQGRLSGLQGEVELLSAKLELTDPQELERARVEVSAARDVLAEAARVRAEAAQVELVARRERRAALARAQAAEAKAARAEAQRRQVTAAVAGHARPLSAAEIERLRAAGPQGPAVFLAAVKRAVKAQARGQRQELKNALVEVARAAIGWRDRL